jgi:hypothetical protein
MATATARLPGSPPIARVCGEIYPFPCPADFRDVTISARVAHDGAPRGPGGDGGFSDSHCPAPIDPAGVCDMTTKQRDGMDRRQDALRDLIVMIDGIINDIESDRANDPLNGKNDRYRWIPTVQVRLAGDTSDDIDGINRRMRACGLADGDILKMEPVPSKGADWFRTYLSIHHPGSNAPFRMIAASREGTRSGRTPFSDEDLLALIEYLRAWGDKVELEGRATTKPPRSRGRPSVGEKEASRRWRIHDTWVRSREAGITKAAFVSHERKSADAIKNVDELNAILGWCRNRRRTKSSNRG